MPDENWVPDVYARYGCIIYADGKPIRQFGGGLEEIRMTLFDVFRANPVYPRGPYYQVRIMDGSQGKYVDLDGAPPDAPDGFLNVEVRIQCGRGIL
jgi:hypothetical protein